MSRAKLVWANKQERELELELELALALDVARDRLPRGRLKVTRRSQFHFLVRGKSRDCDTVTDTLTGRTE